MSPRSTELAEPGQLVDLGLDFGLVGTAGQMKEGHVGGFGVLLVEAVLVAGEAGMHHVAPPRDLPAVAL
jgi:hypothetical protein